MYKKWGIPGRGPMLAVCAMALVVTLANIGVLHPLGTWLTWGALPYPLAFLVCDLSNRCYGPAMARRIALGGFLAAPLLWGLLDLLNLAPFVPRIAAASGTAFVSGLLLDITLFHYLRTQAWWRAPLLSSLAAGTLDTALFFSLAFGGSGLPWLYWAGGDLAVKCASAFLLLLPFRWFLSFMMRSQARLGATP